MIVRKKAALGKISHKFIFLRLAHKRKMKENVAKRFFRLESMNDHLGQSDYFG